jgi:hypothetical protein
MSFTASAQGTTFEAGWFLVDDESCLRETATIAADHAQKVTRNGRVIVPMGAVIPANGATAKGILYEDIDVTDGDAPGSIVTKGVIYGDRLPAALDSDAATALTEIKVITASPAIVRPTEFSVFKSFDVTSVAGSASGKTKLGISGYNPANGETLVYKTNSTTAPAVNLGDDLSSGWTDWNGTDDITATTGHKITVAGKDAYGKAVAAGSTDVTSKA